MRKLQKNIGYGGFLSNFILVDVVELISLSFDFTKLVNISGRNQDISYVIL